jgi:hypothetical protein
MKIGRWDSKRWDVADTLLIIFLIAFLLIVSHAQTSNAVIKSLESKITQYQNAVFACTNAQGGGFTIMEGYVPVASVLCFPVNTRQIGK